MYKKEVFILVLAIFFLVLLPNISANNVSLYASELNVSSFNFSSSDYIEVVAKSFNTTHSNRSFIFLSSMNIHKTSGELSNQVSMKVFVDGTQILEQSLRTLSKIDDIGTTGSTITNFTTSSPGIHNITVWFKRNGDGSILVDDIDMVILEDETTDNGIIEYRYISDSTTFSSTDYNPVINWTINNTIPSPYLILVKQTINSTRIGIPSYPNSGGYNETTGINMSNNVVLFHFNETSGNIIDQSGQSNDGNVLSSTYGVEALFGTALNFDGINDRVKIDNSPDINLGTFTERTVEVWFRVDDKTIVDKQVIFEEGNAITGLNIYIYDSTLYVGAWNEPRRQSNWDGTWLTTRSIESNKWHQVIVVLNGTSTIQDDSLKGYLDGIKFGSGEGSQLWPHTGDINLGKSGGTKFHDGDDNSNGEFFAGDIDEFAIYNRVLSDEDALNRFDSITVTIGSYFTNQDDNQESPIWKRLLSGPSDLGSVLGTWIQETAFSLANMSLNSKNFQQANTSSTERILEFPLINNNSKSLTFFQASNPGTNKTVHVNYSAGTHNLINKTVQIVNGSGYFISMTTSFSSVNGNFTPMFFINSSNINQNDCYSKKERTLESNSDIGNAFIYTICKNLVPNNNYTFNLWVTIPAGKTLTQIDENMNGFEISRLNITTQASIPPIPNEITNPQNGSYKQGFKNITWLDFSDPDGDFDHYKIYLIDLSDNSSTTLNSSTTNIYQTINFSSYSEGSYSLIVQGCDATSLCLNSSSEFFIDTTNPVISSQTENYISNSSIDEDYAFNCSISDNMQLSNITFYITNASNGSFSGDDSSIITGTSKTEIFYKNILSGNYTWNCLVYDSAGNYVWGTNRNFTVDADAPTIDDITTTPALPLNNNGSEEIINVNLTSSEYPINITFNLYNSTGSIVNTTTTQINSTAFLPTNYTIPNTLSDGIYYLNMTAADSAGNTNITALGNITVDSGPSQITNIVTEPSMPVYNNGSTQIINLTFTSSEYPINITFNLYNSSGSIVNTSTVQINSTAFLPTNYTIPNTLPDGVYTLNLTVTDEQSNTNVTELGNVTVDSIFPTIDDTTTNPSLPLSNSGGSQDVSVNFTSSEYPINITFNLYNSSGSLVDTQGPTTFNNSAELPSTYTISVDLINGIYSLNMTISDLSGNENISSLGNITVTNTITTEETSTSGGGSGGGGSIYHFSEIKTTDETLDLDIKIGPSSTKEIEIENNKETKIKKVSIDSDNSFSGKIKIKNLEEKPNNCIISNNYSNYIIYKILDINSTIKKEDMKKVSLDLIVEKSWIDKNSIVKIIGLKCSPTQEELDITKLEEETDFEIHTLSSESFSIWTVLGLKEETNNETKLTTNQEEIIKNTTDSTKSKKKSNFNICWKICSINWIWWVIIYILFIILLIHIFKNEKKHI